MLYKTRDCSVLEINSFIYILDRLYYLYCIEYLLNESKFYLMKVLGLKICQRIEEIDRTWYA